jgi:hypothetical protein
MPGTYQRGRRESRTESRTIGARPAVRAFGNVLHHAYDQVDPVRIWEIVTQDISDLASAVESALARHDQDSPDRH